MWWHMHENQILKRIRAISHFLVFGSKPQSYDKPEFKCIQILFETQTLVHFHSVVRTKLAFLPTPSHDELVTFCTKIWTFPYDLLVWKQRFHRLHHNPYQPVLIWQRVGRQAFPLADQWFLDRLRPHCFESTDPVLTLIVYLEKIF